MILKNYRSEHWMDGGTGLTNFNRDEVHIYLKAIFRYRKISNRRIWISTSPLLYKHSPPNDYSLHRFYKGDLSEFWNIFYQYKKELKNMKYKKGDKLRCIEPNDFLTLGDIYTFDRYNVEHNQRFVYLEETDNNGFYPHRFELVVDTFEEQIRKANELILARKFVRYKYSGTTNNKFIPTSLSVFYPNSSGMCQLVQDHLEDNPFCVTLRDAFYTIPISCIIDEETCITVENVGDYSATVECDTVTVGCQTIPWSKIEEIIEAHNKLQ